MLFFIFFSSHIMLIFSHIQVAVATILLYSTLESPQFFLHQKLCLVDISEGTRNGAEKGQVTNCRTRLRSAPGRDLINKSCDIWKKHCHGRPYRNQLSRVFPRKLPYHLNFFEEWIGRTERVPLNVPLKLADSWWRFIYL